MSKREFDGKIKSSRKPVGVSVKKLENVHAFNYDLDESRQLSVRLAWCHREDGSCSARYRFFLQDKNRAIARSPGPEWLLASKDCGVGFSDQQTSASSSKYLFARVQLSVTTLKFIISPQARDTGGRHDNILVRLGDPEGVFIGYYNNSHPDTCAVFLPVYLSPNVYQKLVYVVSEILTELDLLTPYIESFRKEYKDFVTIESKPALERIIWALFCDVYTHRLSSKQLQDVPKLEKQIEIDALKEKITTSAVLMVFYAAGYTAKDNVIQEVLDGSDSFIDKVTEKYVSPFCIWLILEHINLDSYTAWFLDQAIC